MLKSYSLGWIMIVYVEYVLINNFIIDYLVLKATFLTTGQSLSKKRLIVSSFLGATLSLVFPLVENVGGISVMVKICCGLLITLVCANYPSARAYFINTIVFFCYTFLMGGVIIGVFNLLNVDYHKEPFVAVMAIPVYILLKFFSGVIKYIYRLKEIRSRTYDITLKLNGKTVTCTGFFDTGNALFDGERPVIVCSKGFFANNFAQQLIKIKLKKITVNTVNGQSENIAVELESVEIYILDKPNIFNNVTLMVSPYSVGDGYDVILHPALYKESGYEKIEREIEKVS